MSIASSFTTSLLGYRKLGSRKLGGNLIPIDAAVFHFGLLREYLVQIHSFDSVIIATLDGIESACLHLRVEFLFGDDTVQLFLGRREIKLMRIGKLHPNGRSSLCYEIE